MEKTLSYLTRPNCQLCSETLPLVQKLSEKYGFALEQINIDASDDLIMAYGMRIPVVVTASGSVLAEGLIDGRVLKKVFRKAARVASQHHNNR